MSRSLFSTGESLPCEGDRRSTRRIYRAGGGVDIEKMFEEQGFCILASGGLSVENDLSRRSFREPGWKVELPFKTDAEKPIDLWRPLAGQCISG